MVTIPARFNGPDHSGNGGYVCGLIGEQVPTDGPVTSMLRLPPPLDVPLAWERSGQEVRLETHGGALIGTASPGAFEREPLPFPDADLVAAGLASYPGFHDHPFDRCFTCGTAREEGDGLRLFTGPVGADRTAGPWHAHAALASGGAIPDPVTWAALDCPGGWAADFTAQTMVLGRMTAQLMEPVAAGDDLHASGRLDDRQGRKFMTSTALHRPDGTLVGRSEQVWIEVDPALFA
ncbi:hypothetical protein [Aeromicrobium sp. Leaf350]|uniref:hypothetical protein n=1 Tax=Aeromicrobium sp. Leaf350 TaxID=2876565 RepID=UPI001E4CB290|nr:hypothetical protein [Aeromicrobium sp. Leaf350]